MVWMAKVLPGAINDVLVNFFMVPVRISDGQTVLLWLILDQTFPLNFYEYLNQSPDCYIVIQLII